MTAGRLSVSVYPLFLLGGSGPFKRQRVSLCLWLSSCMSFNFIKLENRKYELTPSTSEPEVPSAPLSLCVEEEMIPGERSEDEAGGTDAEEAERRRRGGETAPA